MASLIHELENNEALLLMYLAGELPAEDHLEVEQMLAADAGFRSELAGIQAAYDGAMGVLTRLDADRTAIPAENHAIRQAMRAMKQWQVDRLSRQPIVAPVARVKIPLWVYPLASMAALLIGTIAWWGFGGQFLHLSVNPATEVATNSTTEPATTAPVASSVDQPVASGVTEDAAAATINPTTNPAPASPEELLARQLNDSLSSDAPAGDSSNSIAEAEKQANSLVARSDNKSVASDIFLTEANP